MNENRKSIGGVAKRPTRPQGGGVTQKGAWLHIGHAHKAARLEIGRGGARLPIRQPPKGAGLHGARGRGSALDTPTRTPKWAGLKALTRGRGFTVNTCQRGGATERKGAWLRLLVPTKGRGYIAQGGVASFWTPTKACAYVRQYEGVALYTKTSKGAWLCPLLAPPTLLGLRPSLSPSLGRALSDWVRRFPGGRGSGSSGGTMDKNLCCGWGGTAMSPHCPPPHN